MYIVWGFDICVTLVVVGLRLAGMVHILMQILIYLFFKYKMSSLKFKSSDLDSISWLCQINDYSQFVVCAIEATGFNKEAW